MKHLDIGDDHPQGAFALRRLLPWHQMKNLLTGCNPVTFALYQNGNFFTFILINNLHKFLNFFHLLAFDFNYHIFFLESSLIRRRARDNTKHHHLIAFGGDTYNRINDRENNDRQEKVCQNTRDDYRCPCLF